MYWAQKMLYVELTCRVRRMPRAYMDRAALSGGSTRVIPWVPRGLARRAGLVPNVARALYVEVGTSDLGCEAPKPALGFRTCITSRSLALWLSVCPEQRLVPTAGRCLAAASTKSRSIFAPTSAAREVPGHNPPRAKSLQGEEHTHAASRPVLTDASRRPRDARTGGGDD
jgi:hypothetical protein